MSSGSADFVTLKGRSLLCCTGTMDQDPHGGRPAGPGIAPTARSSQGGDRGIPAPYHAACPGLFLFPEYGAAGGDRS
jgi:hypothetical protein